MNTPKQTQRSSEDLPKGALVILKSAKQLFAAKGFDAVSITDIARLADVSKANIFHHFASKKALYLAVIRDACDETAGHFVTKNKIGKAEEDLWMIFSSQLMAMLENRQSVRLIQREIADSDSGGNEQELAEHVFKDVFTQLVQIVKAGQQQKYLRRDFDPALFAYMMLGANVFYSQNHRITAFLDEGKFASTTEGYSRDVFDLMLKGVISTDNEDSSPNKHSPEAG